MADEEIHPTCLEVSNIRTFKEHQVVPLHHSLTVLCGVNNSGKSSLLQTIRGIARAVNGHDLLGTLTRDPNLPVVALLHYALDGKKLEAPCRRIRTVSGNVGVAIDPDSSRLRLRDGGNHLRLDWGTDEWIHIEERRLTGFQGEKAVKHHDEHPSRLTDLRALTLPMTGAIGYWSHETPGDAFRDLGHKKRLCGVRDVVGALTYLRLKAPEHFDLLEHALHKAFPEFDGITFEEESENIYSPRLEYRGRAKAPLSRESFGAGVWVYLCVLLATRVAYATGARTMLLDEPTLFMHPRLERLLLRELLDPSEWPDGHLQVIVATHSPTFVDHAVRHGGLRIVDWSDTSKLWATVYNPDADSKGGLARALARMSTTAADIFYAEDVLFVEGPSDLDALLELGPLVKNPCRVLALRVKDSFRRKEGLQLLPHIARLKLGGVSRARILFDGDSRPDFEAAISKVGVDAAPVAFFAGGDGQDFESLFCDVEFLLAFFFEAWARSEVTPPNIKHLREQVNTAVLAVESNASKGDKALEPLFQRIPGGDNTKLEQLPALARFFIENRTKYPKIAENLSEVLRALEAEGANS